MLSASSEMEKIKAQYLLGVVLSGGANLLGMGASLLTIMVAARLLSQEELGSFFLLLLVAQVTALFGDIGFQNTAIKTLSQLPADSPEFIHTARYLLTMAIATSLLACLCMGLTVPFLTSLWPSPNFVSHVGYIAPVALLTTGMQTVMSLLVGAKQFRVLSSLSIGIEILRALFSMGGLFAGLGISSLLWGMIGSRIIGIGVIWCMLPLLFSIQLRHPRSADFLKFGGWLYGCSLVSVIMVRTSDTILTTYMGTAALAVYSAAMQVPSVLQRAFESIRPTLLGYITAQNTTYKNPQITLIRMMTALLAVAATGLITLAQPLMTLLYSEKYEAGIMIMQALSVWVVFTIINYLYSIILIGNGQSKKAFILTLPQLCTIVIASGVLVPRYQGFGAATALVLTAFLGNLIGARLVAGDNVSTRHLLTTGFLRAAVPLLLFLIAAASLASSFALLCGCAGITLLLLMAFKAVTLEDCKVLRATLLGMGERMSALPSGA